MMGTENYKEEITNNFLRMRGMDHVVRAANVVSIHLM